MLDLIRKVFFNELFQHSLSAKISVYSILFFLIYIRYSFVFAAYFSRLDCCAAANRCLLWDEEEQVSMDAPEFFLNIFLSKQ